MSLIISTEPPHNIEDALDLYVNVGWGTAKDYEEEKYAKAFSSSYVYSAYWCENLVGLLRFLTDEQSTTYIVELVVQPQYQHKGIGSALLECLVKNHGKTTIYAESTQEFMSFYLNRCFKEHKLVGMSRKAE